MKLKQLIKGLAVALPMLTLAACSSTSSSTTAGESTEQSTTPVVTQPSETVQTGAIEPVLTAEEQIQQQKEALMADNTIYFAFDQSDILNDYYDMLTAHAEFLRENPNVTMIIEGHADERGTPEYNVALGERRGNSVSTYLMSMGVNYNQIEVVSYGEEKPENPSRTESAWAQNRRAVLSY